MIVYTNGDSFVAGVELGDDLIPEHPGYLPFVSIDDPLFLQNRKWIEKTYSIGHPLNDIRRSKKKEITDLEFKRAFPNKLNEKTNIKVHNRAMGGSSMDRIVRTSVTDLIELKKEHTEIVAIISATSVTRSEICNFEDNLYGDLHGDPMAWHCLSTAYTNNVSAIEEIRKYKILYEKDYHQYVNFYRNIILLQDFCAINKIKLLWVNTGHCPSGNKDIKIEAKYKDCRDIKNFLDYANLNFAVDMQDIAKSSKSNSVLCPSGHYAEAIHDLVSDALIKIIS